MISIFVPALNEEANIRQTVDSVRRAAREANNVKHEIIIVNDGSTDRTGQIIEELKGQFPEVVGIQKEINEGLGAGLKDALKIARYEKFLIVPGDNDLSHELLVALFSNSKKADLIMTYFLNREIRGVGRNVISTIFGSIYMITFGIFVQYINGPCLYPTEKLRHCNLKANRFSIVVEATIKLLCSGATYYEVAGYMQKGLAGSTSLSTRNLREVVRLYLRLLFEIKICKNPAYQKRPSRVY